MQLSEMDQYRFWVVKYVYYYIQSSKKIENVM